MDDLLSVTLTMFLVYAWSLRRHTQYVVDGCVILLVSTTLSCLFVTG